MPKTKEDVISLWGSSAAEPDAGGSLHGEIKTDITVVGAGFAGLSTALQAAEAGHNCHVPEAQKIGYGASGRNVGLVNAGLWLPPQDVREDVRAKLGEARGTRLIELLGEAPSYVFSLIEKYHIRCEPRRSGTIHASHSRKGFEDLARRAEEWKRLGAPVELMSAGKAAEKIGTRVFHGGLLDRRAGTINPIGYVQGLARAAQGAGAKISTGATAESMNREGDRWVLTTSRGKVRARNVVIGTNAYSDELWPGLRQSFTPLHYFQVATEPLGERAAHILREGQGLWDTAPSSRCAAMRSGESSSDRWEGSSAATAVSRADGRQPDCEEYFPNLAWSRSRMLGMSGGREDDLPLPVTDPKDAPNHSAAGLFCRAVFAANQVVKSI